MASTTSRGNYYKTKSKKYYEDLGYTVQITEFMCGRVIAPGKVIYCKKDVFGSDGIAMNGNEIIFWNAKHTTTNDISWVKSTGKKEFQKYPFPDNVIKHLIIWQPRKKQPEIIIV
jgi:hypothetical protein